MVKHSKIGIKGEQIAADFLLKKGYIIVFKNWRAGKKEVDIIAFRDDLLVIVEVKTRSGVSFSYPEESVNFKKRQNLKAAADAFLEAFPIYKNVRFDIISVILEHDSVKEITHFEEAFH